MMKSIAQEMTPYGVRVEQHRAGTIRTPINMRRRTRPSIYAGCLSFIPYERVGEAEESATRRCGFCRATTRITFHGVALFVDGSMTLYPDFETGG